MTSSTPKKGISKKILIVVGCIFAGGILIAAISDSGKTEASGKDKEITEKTGTETKTEEKKADTQRDAIIEKIKAKAKRDWPEDYTLQELTINQQTEDYDYMQTIADTDPIKKKVQKDWPIDFTLQKLMYNEEFEAKERVK